jgi:hypothetical protein
VAISLKLHRNGAVGFIDWLDGRCRNAMRMRSSSLELADDQEYPTAGNNYKGGQNNDAFGALSVFVLLLCSLKRALVFGRWMIVLSVERTPDPPTSPHLDHR